METVSKLEEPSATGHHSPSIRDLAARLGLSASTVSRALRHAPNTNPATRERVLKAAKAAGYRSNALVNSLMVQVRQRRRLKPSGEVVAFLTTSVSEDTWRTLHSHVQQFEGARDRARVLGFDVQPMWLGEAGVRSGQTAQVMRARGIRGALLAPIGGRQEARIELDWQHQAVVAMGYLSLPVPLNRMCHDLLSLTSECYAALWATGHRRIGIAAPVAKGLRGQAWVTAFLGVQWWHGVRSEKQSVQPLIYPENKDPLGVGGAELDAIGCDMFLRWFEEQKPDAVIGIWPDRPLEWLRQHGVQVPKVVSYATLDLNEPRQIAGMWQDNRRLGTVAMDVLAGQFFRNEIGLPNVATVTSITGTWMDGTTIRCR